MKRINFSKKSLSIVSSIAVAGTVINPTHSALAKDAGDGNNEKSEVLSAGENSNPEGSDLKVAQITKVGYEEDNTRLESRKREILKESVDNLNMSVSLIKEGTGHGTSDQSFINEENGFTPGDNTEDDGYVTAGDLVIYEFAMNFSEGEERAIDILWSDVVSTEGGDSGVVTNLCDSSGAGIEAFGKNDGFCRYVISEGASGSITRQIAFVAPSSPNGETRYKWSPTLHTSNGEIPVDEVTVLSAPILDINFGNSRRSVSYSGRESYIELNVDGYSKNRDYNYEKGEFHGKLKPFDVLVDVSGFPEDVIFPDNEVENGKIRVTIDDTEKRYRINYALPEKSVEEAGEAKQKWDVSFSVDGDIKSVDNALNNGDGSDADLDNNSMSMKTIRKSHTRPGNQVAKDINSVMSSKGLYDEESIHWDSNAKVVERNVAPGTQISSDISINAHNARTDSNLHLIDVWDIDDAKFDASRDVEVIFPEDMPGTGKEFEVFYNTSDMFPGDKSSPDIPEWNDNTWTNQKPEDPSKIVGVMVTFPNSSEWENNRNKVLVRIPQVALSKEAYGFTEGNEGGSHPIPDWFTLQHSLGDKTVRTTPKEMEQIEAVGRVSPKPFIQRSTSTRNNAKTLGDIVSYSLSPYIYDSVTTDRDSLTPTITEVLDKCLESITIPSSVRKKYNVEIIGYPGQGCGDDTKDPAKIVFTPKDDVVYTSGNLGILENEINKKGLPRSILSTAISLPDIQYSAKLSRNTPAYEEGGYGYTNEATIRVEEALEGNKEDVATQTVSILQKTDVASVKTSHSSKVGLDDTISWNLKLMNYSGRSGNAEFIDVLPFNGSKAETADGTRTNFSGKLKFVNAEFIEKPRGARILYTSHRPGDIDTENHNQPDVQWHNSVSGAGGFDNITAIKVIIPDFGDSGKNYMDLKLDVKVEGNQDGDTYVNKMSQTNVEASDLEVPAPGAVSVTSKASSITGNLWWDKDHDYTNNNEEGLEGIEVYARKIGDDEIISTTTDANGQYHFDEIKSGMYEVWFDRGDGDDDVPLNGQTTYEKQEEVKQTFSHGEKYDDFSEARADLSVRGGDDIEDVNFGFYIPDPIIKVDKNVQETSDNGDGTVTIKYGVDVLNTGTGKIRDLKLMDSAEREQNISSKITKIEGGARYRQVQNYDLRDSALDNGSGLGTSSKVLTIDSYGDLYIDSPVSNYSESHFVSPLSYISKNIPLGDGVSAVRMHKELPIVELSDGSALFLRDGSPYDNEAMFAGTDFGDMFNSEYISIPNSQNQAWPAAIIEKLTKKDGSRISIRDFERIYGENGLEFAYRDRSNNDLWVFSKNESDAYGLEGINQSSNHKFSENFGNSRLVKFGSSYNAGKGADREISYRTPGVIDVGSQKSYEIAYIQKKSGEIRRIASPSFTTDNGVNPEKNRMIFKKVMDSEKDVIYAFSDTNPMNVIYLKNDGTVGYNKRTREGYQNNFPADTFSTKKVFIPDNDSIKGIAPDFNNFPKVNAVEDNPSADSLKMGYASYPDADITRAVLVGEKQLYSLIELKPRSENDTHNKGTGRIVAVPINGSEGGVDMVAQRFTTSGDFYWVEKDGSLHRMSPKNVSDDIVKGESPEYDSVEVLKSGSINVDNFEFFAQGNGMLLNTIDDSGNLYSIDVGNKSEELNKVADFAEKVDTPGVYKDKEGRVFLVNSPFNTLAFKKEIAERYKKAIVKNYIYQDVYLMENIKSFVSLYKNIYSSQENSEEFNILEIVKDNMKHYIDQRLINSSDKEKYFKIIDKIFANHHSHNGSFNIKGVIEDQEILKIYEDIHSSPFAGYIDGVYATDYFLDPETGSMSEEYYLNIQDMDKEESNAYFKKVLSATALGNTDITTTTEDITPSKTTTDGDRTVRTYDIGEMNPGDIVHFDMEATVNKENEDKFLSNLAWAKSPQTPDKFTKPENPQIPSSKEEYHDNDWGVDADGYKANIVASDDDDLYDGVPVMITADDSAPERVTIGGVSWDDENEDGVRQDGENGRVSNVKVTIYTGEGDNEEVVGETFTDDSGAWSYDVEVGRDYRVEFSPAEIENQDNLYVPSPQDAGSDDTKDSDGPSVELTAISEESMSVDMGYIVSEKNFDVSKERTGDTPNVVPGETFTDTYEVRISNNTGEDMKLGEIVDNPIIPEGMTLEKFEVQLQGMDKVSVDPREEGEYLVGDPNSNINAGETKVFTVTMTIMADKSLDVDDIDNGDYGNTVSSITHGDMDKNPDNNGGGDFGVDKGGEPITTIGGVAWKDDGDGIRQDSETELLPNVKVVISTTGDSSEVVGETMTDDSGHWNMEVPMNSAYKISFSTSEINDPENKYVETVKDAGSDDTKDSDGSEFTTDVIDGAKSHYDIGYIVSEKNFDVSKQRTGDAPTIVPGEQFTDTFEVNITNDTGKTQKIGRIIDTPVIPDGLTLEKFEVAPQGEDSETITALPEGGYLISNPDNTINDGETITFTVIMTVMADKSLDVDDIQGKYGNTVSSEDFDHFDRDKDNNGGSDLPITKGGEPITTLSGTAWKDDNEDGIRQEDETKRIANVKVVVSTTGDNPQKVAETTTTGDGSWSIEVPMNTDYKVEFFTDGIEDVENKYMPSPQDVGDNDDIDSDGPVIMVSALDGAKTYDMGYVVSDNNFNVAKTRDSEEAPTAIPGESFVDKFTILVENNTAEDSILGEVIDTPMIPEGMSIEKFEVSINDSDEVQEVSAEENGTYIVGDKDMEVKAGESVSIHITMTVKVDENFNPSEDTITGYGNKASNNTHGDKDKDGNDNGGDFPINKGDKPEDEEPNPTPDPTPDPEPTETETPKPTVTVTKTTERPSKDTEKPSETKTPERTMRAPEPQQPSTTRITQPPSTIVETSTVRQPDNNNGNGGETFQPIIIDRGNNRPAPNPAPAPQQPIVVVDSGSGKTGPVVDTGGEIDNSFIAKIKRFFSF